MSLKNFSHLAANTIHDPPHRAVSRAPANHNVLMTLLGCMAAAAVLAVLWALYAV